jgi:hypothetical protein
MSFSFHVDSGLVTPETSRTVIEVIGDGYVDIRTTLGDPDAAYKWQAASNPGVDAIEVTVDDTNPAGGMTTSMVKLALTPSGLAGATAGAPLAVGNTVFGGDANAVEVWVRVSTGLVAETTLSDLRLLTTEVVRVPV